ncbi:MAG: trans-2-enoyl-CoA reductase family protein [Fibrobacterales bacterium]
MVIKPKIRGFICTTAHPKGCEQLVKNQIEIVKNNGTDRNGPKKVLVIGSSQGFGLASRVSLTFGYNADTLGVFFEKPSLKGRTASSGWYQTAAFEKEATAAGKYCKSINGDAFSDEIKEKAIAAIKEDLGQIDMLIYSLAAPRRTNPRNGETYSSTLKPRKADYTNKTIDTNTSVVSDITLHTATQEEVDNTVAVMGGEDWKFWVDALKEAGVVSEGFTTIAYSYIGPEVTTPIYREGTIGSAKEHLENTGLALNEELKALNGRAYVSVNKALVTQSSSAIPVIPLYIGMLYKAMKKRDIHEGCIQQIERMFTEKIYNNGSVVLDDAGRIRVDDWELRDDVQAEVKELWTQINTENASELSDQTGYQKDFLNLFGFDFPEVDYEAEYDPDVKIKGLID